MGDAVNQNALAVKCSAALAVCAQSDSAAVEIAKRHLCSRCFYPLLYPLQNIFETISDTVR
jgi:hypothetical protein